MADTFIQAQKYSPSNNASDTAALQQEAYAAAAQVNNANTSDVIASSPSNMQKKPIVQNELVNDSQQVSVQPYSGGTDNGVINAGAASGSASGTPYQTTYTDSRGNVQVGYIINGKTYTDAQGTTEVPYGSYVTDAGGRVWRKGTGYGGASELVYSPNAEDHYNYNDSVANTKEIEFVNPVTGKTNYIVMNPDQGKNIIYDSGHNSIGYIDSAGVLHSSTPDDEYDIKTSQAAINAATALGYTFNGDGIVKIAEGQDLNVEKAYLLNQLWDELQAGGDGAEIIKKLNEIEKKNSSGSTANPSSNYTPQAVTHQESSINLQPVSENEGARNFEYTAAPIHEVNELIGITDVPTLQSADMGDLRTQVNEPSMEAAQQGYVNANAEQAENSYTNVTAPERAEYTPADLTTQINKVHDEAFNLAKTQIENQLAQGELEIDQAIEKLPQIYEAGINDMAQQYELNKRNANEYFNANGLTSGARAQALLAMNNVYQANMAAYRMEQANAIQNYEDKRAQLKLEAQGAITEALLQNEQNRASDLLAEWQRQDEENLKLFLETLDQDYKYYALELDKQLKEASLAEEARQFDITTQENRITRDLNYNLDVAKLEEQARQADNENSIKLYQIAESIREFNANHDLDLAKLQESARQADNELQLAQAKFDEGVREFNLGYNVDVEKLKESVRQAENEYALSYAKYEEAIREFEAEYAYKYAALNEDARQFNEQMEYNYAKANLSGGNPSLALSLDEGEGDNGRANVSYDNSFEGFAERVQDADYYNAVAKISSSRMSEAQARQYLRSLSTDLFSDTPNSNLTDAQIQLILKDADLLRNIRS